MKEIIQFDEWIKDNYEYDLITDLEILKKAERATFDSKVRENIESIRKRLIDSKRPEKDKLSVKQYCYTLYYLMNFVKYQPDNFDKLFSLVNKGKPVFIPDLQKF